jgi:coenzyme F420-reducing hydrogenase beta subunit
LQTQTTGCLHEASGERIRKIEVDFIRNYGQDVDHYVDSYPSEGRVVIATKNGKMEREFPYAVFDETGEGIEVCQDYSSFKDIRLTSNGPVMIPR